MSRNKLLVAVSGIVISFIFLWFAFRNLHPQQVWMSIQQANGLLLVAAAVWFFVSLIVIALRWQFLLNVARHISLRDLTGLVSIGYAGNNIYPFRSGELLRIALLRRNHAVPFARGTTTVVVERVFDGLVMLTFVLVPLLISDVPSPEVRTVASVAAPVFLGATLIFFVLAAQPNLLRWLYAPVNRLLPERLRGPVYGLVEDVLTGLDGLRSPADLAGPLRSAFGEYVLDALVYWLGVLALWAHIDFRTLFLEVDIVNLAGLTRDSPRQFGVFQ